MSEIDWTDILTCQDIEVATMLFTNKFRAVLDYHVPWVVYQQRKFHRPWLTNETLALMKERDLLKKEAIKLHLTNRGSAEIEEAWSKFKRLRNQINNLKKK